MAGSFLRVEVNYNPRLTRGEQALLELPARLRGLRRLMIQGVAPVVNKMLKRHWDSKGAAFGHAWAPWAPSTLAARIRKGNASKGLMRDTDHLFRVLFRARSTDDRLKIVAGGLRLQLNTGVPYGIFHQLGTSNMPERQIIPDPLPRSFVRTVRDVVRVYILTGKIQATYA
jgi:hypothetical protein